MKSRTAELLFLLGCLLVAIGLWRWSASLALVFVGTLLAVCAVIIGAPDVVLAITGRKRKEPAE